MPNSISLPVAPPSLLPGSPNLAQLHAALRLDDSESNAEQRVVLPTSDGLELQATLFEPQVQARAVAMLAPATGVPQRYYAPFARWLALQGYAVITFDYRGMGASPAGAQPPSMRDWMLEDLPAVLRAAKHRASPQVGTRRLPLLWVGHSLGGWLCWMGLRRWMPWCALARSCPHCTAGRPVMRAGARRPSSSGGFRCGCGLPGICRAGHSVAACPFPAQPLWIGRAGARWTTTSRATRPFARIGAPIAFRAWHSSGA